MQSADAADSLARIQARGRLVWGADAEGGGPYVFPEPADPRRMTGFEAELAAALAGELGVKAEFMQAPWDELPALLNTGQIDVVLNGYELTPARLERMLPAGPYYVYRLVLLARRDEPSLADWSDLRAGAAKGAQRTKVGALVSSAAYQYLAEHFGDDIDLIGYKGTTDAMREVETGKLDATVTDLPAAIYYAERFAGLRRVGEAASKGYYVLYVRPGEDTLQAALNDALRQLLDDGRLRQIYTRYDLWSDDQEQLASLIDKSPESLGVHALRTGGWQVIAERGPILLEAAGMTVLLACASMPLAIVLGLAVALGRMYGPAPLRWLLVGYVEILRGTPLLLQLYVIFYLLPEFGLRVPALAAAIAGLAINYSAYEAEIYRAGLQAVPRGQMEAALALGMTPALALRRIVVPQAVRIVIPPVTNDFIALFKDTSVCSVITVMELTGAYSIQRNDTGATVELALLTGLLYLGMSLPLAWLTRRCERRLGDRRLNPAAG